MSIQPLPKQLPSGFFPLILCEIWDTFSYYGTRSLLVLYLTHQLLLSDEQAYDIYSTYIAFGFLTPLIGGYLADRFIGHNNAIVIGGAALIIGNVLLALSGIFLQLNYLFIALPFMLFGTGALKSNTAASLGLLYKNNNLHRQSGFTLFYMAKNIGAITGITTYGFIAFNYAWHIGFLLSAIGTALSLINYLHKNKPTKLKINIHLHDRKLLIILLTIGLIISGILFRSAEYTINSIGIFSTIGFLTLTLLITYQARKYYKTLLFIALLIFIAIFYYAAEMQVGSSLMLFIDRHINTHILGVLIPPTLFAALGPLCIIALSPVMTILWRYLKEQQLEPTDLLKVILGLLLASIGFVMFALSSWYAMSHENTIPLLWILLGFILLSTGELFIEPTVVAYISHHAPKKYLGTFMGMWYMSITLASSVGNLMSDLTISPDVLDKNTLIYTQAFITISVIVAGGSIFLLLFMPLLQRLGFTQK